MAGAVEVAAAAKVPASTAHQLHRSSGGGEGRPFLGDRDWVPSPGSRESFKLKQVFEPHSPTQFALFDADVCKSPRCLVDPHTTRKKVRVVERRPNTPTVIRSHRWSGPRVPGSSSEARLRLL